MKFRVTMKDPDGAYDSIEEAAAEMAPEGLSPRERESFLEIRRETLKEFAGKWLECGEYLTVEFDTEAGTCVVVPKD